MKYEFELLKHFIKSHKSSEEQIDVEDIQLSMKAQNPIDPNKDMGVVETILNLYSTLD